MKLYFKTRQAARDFKSTLAAKNVNSKVVDTSTNNTQSVNGTRYAADLKVS